MLSREIASQHRLPRPLLPRGAVQREALEQRLDLVPPGGLGLVIAPAGAGKSVLVRQWSRRTDTRLAAIGLERRHDDAVVLARDLLHAIRAVEPDVPDSLMALVMAGGAKLGSAFVDGLLDALDAARPGLGLVIEDIHRISNPAVLHELGTLLTGLPTTTRMVATSRLDPPWPLHQLRLEGRLVELRGADLAFDLEDGRELLVAVSGCVLDDIQVKQLVERTDGWAAGLQLAAITLQGADDVATRVDSFTGSDRVIADYLMEEVVEHLEPELRHFLLCTSVLDWFTAELCDAVTGGHDARAMLDELEHRCLFVIPLDRSRTRFRYHHLFADLLRYRLGSEDPDAPAALHTAAAAWLADHGHLDDAVDHLLAGGQNRVAFEIIAREGHRWFERGESATLVRWLTTLCGPGGEEPIDAAVNLLAAQVAADESAGAAETYRHLVKRPDLGLGARIAADTLYSLLVLRELPPDECLRLTAAVRDALPVVERDQVVDFLGVGGSDSIEAMVAYASGWAWFLNGDLDQSAASLSDALHLPGAGYPLWRVYAQGTLALVRGWAGHAAEATRLAEGAIDLAERFGVVGHVALVGPHLALAVAHLDRAEAAEAAARLHAVATINRRRTTSFVLFDLQRFLEARLAALTSGPHAAISVLREPPACAVEPVVIDRARRGLEAGLRIRAGELLRAEQLLEGSTVEGPDRLATWAGPGIDLALARHDLAAARELLDGWEPTRDDVRGAVSRLIRLGVLLEAQGDHPEARRVLADAVHRASHDELRGPFLEVPAAVRLLRRGPVPDAGFLERVLRGGVAGIDARRAARQALIEPLTDRELTVLAYLPGRLRNQEIASDLFISVNTLKTHLSRIYRKLGVTDRDEAVERATDLGLL